MKTIFFVRHAKSSWDDLMLPDHDRPLNNRGKSDAIAIGEYLLKKDIKIDIVIYSSARRAKSTAKRIDDVLKSDNFIVEPRLYHASAREMFGVIANIHSEVDSAMIVAHNPGMTDMINMFSDVDIINVPTAGVFKVDFDINDWVEADTYNGKLNFFIYPKMLSHG
jgi:phosphohistidine phosphatase